MFFNIYAQGSELKIIKAVANNDSLTLTFNRNISRDDFKIIPITKSKNLGLIYEIKANLTLPRKSFNIQNSLLVLAQFNKQTVRLVINTNHAKAWNLIINKHQASIVFNINKDKKINIKEHIKEDKKDTKDIKDLFSSINPVVPKGDDHNLLKEHATSDYLTQNTSDIVAHKLRIKKTIVIDPGHGGKDCGAYASNICEKELVLSISKMLNDILIKRNYKVHMTRNKDIYISLIDRTKFANNKNADIFISVHANALAKTSKSYLTTRGIETYFLSNAKSERARRVAEVENRDDIEVMNYYSKQNVLNFLNLQRILASNKLAIDIQSGMLTSTRAKFSNVVDGGVREGPFWILVGTLMPSVLIEVGYLTHEKEGRQLQDKSYQRQIAEGIADGIDNYFLKNF